MGDLQHLAWEIGADERTLRRAVSAGAVRCRRPTPRRLEVGSAERAYLRSHWPLLAALRGVLRTEPNIRFAALFGSLARGDEHQGSDLDLVVELGKRDRRGMRRVQSKLERALGYPVELLYLADAERSPLLLDDLVREGRVLVDRAGRWPALRRRSREIARAARRARERALAEEREAVAYFEREAAAA